MIDELILRSLQGQTSRPEEERLRMWRSRSPENEARYWQTREIWLLAGNRSAVPAIPALPDPNALIDRAEAAGIGAAAPDARGPTPEAIAGWAPPARSWGIPLSRRAAAGLLAASLAVVSFGLGILAYERSAGTPGVTYGEIVTGPGEMATFTLGDGTAIRVGPESTLRLLNEGDNPTVWLDGLAFFGVHPDPSRRFTVRTPHGEATALGTRFEVRSEDQEFRVVVVEGVVRVSAAGVAVELPQGLMSESREGAPLTSSRVDDVEGLLAWMGRTLMFHDTPLTTAVAEIEARYDADFVIEDESLRDLSLTVTLIDRPIEAVVAIVCESIGAECALEGGQVRIAAPAGAVGQREAGPPPNHR